VFSNGGFNRCIEELQKLLSGFGENLGIDGKAVSSWSSEIMNEKSGLASDTDLLPEFCATKSVRTSV
jgi:hypothetical protein